jgi:hypothetical protein
VLLDQTGCAEACGGASLWLYQNVLVASSQQSMLLLDQNAALRSVGDVSLAGMRVGGTVKLQATLQAAGSSAELSMQGAKLQGPIASVSGLSSVSVTAPFISIG